MEPQEKPYDHFIMVPILVSKNNYPILYWLLCEETKKYARETSLLKLHRESVEKGSQGENDLRSDTDKRRDTALYLKSLEKTEAKINDWVKRNHLEGVLSKTITQRALYLLLSNQENVLRSILLIH